MPETVSPLTQAEGTELLEVTVSALKAARLQSVLIATLAAETLAGRMLAASDLEAALRKAQAAIAHIDRMLADVEPRIAALDKRRTPPLARTPTTPTVH
jgi:hypothetical protein